jgi:hypothetical protein
VSYRLARRAIGAAAALTAALAPTLATVTPAQARTYWVTAPCATGQFTAIGTSVDGQTALHGQITKCAPADPKSVFTLVAFHPRDSFPQAYRHSLLPYQAEGSTPFSGVFRTMPSDSEVGVCAMRSVSDRVACVRVTFPQDGDATMEPIPTTDPLVSKPVFFDDWSVEPPPPPPGGFCGTCLELPV